MTEVCIKIFADLLQTPIILYKYEIDEKFKQRFNPDFGDNQENLEDENCLKILFIGKWTYGHFMSIL